MQRHNTRFQGFTADTLRFLLENKMNDSKQWYDSHKDEYKRFVYNPFAELTNMLAQTMLEIDSQIITKPSRVISRVRRDTRFTKDKTLYRDHMWIVFLRDKSRMAILPGFWFEINQWGSSYGVGFYHATAQSMAHMRKLIMERHPAFLLAQRYYENQNQFVMGGQLYKRSKAPDQPENIRTWMDRRNIFFECAEKGYKTAFSKDLPDILKEGFKSLKPIYDFISIVAQNDP
ncbi:MAG: DUF2461 domain-containing protein [Clostridiaceae bacterium]|nr:DUF2461 domain-containing protein [Clostridiaceae bacterium]